MPSASALAWVGYASAVVSADAGAPQPGDDVPSDVVGAFRNYLDEWRTAAERAPEFFWTTDVPSEMAEYLILAFYRVVQRLAKLAEARGEPLSPPEGQAFYAMLVHRLLDALAEEGPGSSEFAAHLRSFWPGL